MYVVITTIKKYKEAFDTLVNSLPKEFKYIAVYQNEEKESYIVQDDGNIQVFISQNLYDYGAFIGVNMLIEKEIVPKDDWFLLLHDTCIAGPKFKESIEYILSWVDCDILWLCSTGQCNLCLIRNMIPHGAKVYDGMNMSKQYAIDIEYRGKDSIKEFPCKQLYLSYQVLFEHPAPIYKDVELYGNRVTVNFENINLKKYHR